MDADLEIRLATEDDLDQLAQMRWEAREEGGERNPNLSPDAFKAECIRIMREWMHDGSHSFWIACMDDFIVAHLAVHRADLLLVYPSRRTRSFYARVGFSDESEVMELRLRAYASPAWISERQ